MTLTSHGQHHCYIQPIACATPNRQMQLAQLYYNRDHGCKKRHHSASRPDTFGQRLGQIPLDTVKHPHSRRTSMPRVSSAKPLGIGSGDSNGRLQKPLCTLTTCGGWKSAVGVVVRDFLEVFQKIMRTQNGFNGSTISR